MYSIELVEAKKKASKLKDYLENIHKKYKLKKDKQYKLTITIIDKFLRCNLNDKSIYSKYERLKNLIEIPNTTRTESLL